MPKFPSAEWFQVVRDVATKDDGLRKLGTCDAVMGVKVGDQAIELTFEAFDLVNIREIQPAELANIDFYLDAPIETWREMLDNIKEHGKADLKHTLNTIDFLEPEGFAKSNDQSRKDLFYRYLQTFQRFFDASAQVETDFATPQPV